jgi:hypothetical protein
MKKSIALILGFLIIFSCIPQISASAESASFVYNGFDIDGFLSEFSQEYSDRTASTENEKAAALYLADKFMALGYNTKNNNAAGVNEDYLQKFSRGKINSENVIAVKPASTATTYNVIIGAHYDNVYGIEIVNPYTQLSYNTQSHGAYDNGSGVAVMMSVAHNIADTPLPFNVTFIAFGAEEEGMLGSEYYLGSLSPSEKKDILLMINLDCVSAGDYLYLFCNDWSTGQDKYLRQRAQDLNIPLRALPFDKKYTTDPFGNGYYSHLAYYSDNYYFLKENIPSAIFMSMNWESKLKAGVVESDRQYDIMHTNKDTYENLRELYPDTYLLYMQYVSSLITNSLERDDFLTAMVANKNNYPDYSFIMNRKNLIVAAFTLWLILAVFAYVYYEKLKARAKKSIEEYMSKPENAEKIKAFFKGFPLPPDMQYPFNTYKPESKDKKFSVFGEEFDKEDEGQDGQDKK